MRRALCMFLLAGQLQILNLDSDRKESSMGGPGLPGSLEPAQHPVLPLKLQVISCSLRTDGLIDATVHVRNLGSSVFPFPRSGDQQKVHAAGNHGRAVLAFLIFVPSPNGRIQKAVVRAAFSSTSDPTSFVPLKPGEELEVRFTFAKEHLLINSGSNLRFGLQQDTLEDQRFYVRTTSLLLESDNSVALGSSRAR